MQIFGKWIFMKRHCSTECQQNLSQNISDKLRNLIYKSQVLNKLTWEVSSMVCQAHSTKGLALAPLASRSHQDTLPFKSWKKLALQFTKGELFLKIFAQLLSFLWSLFLPHASPAPGLIRSRNTSIFFLPLPCWSRSRHVKTLFPSEG